MLANFYSAVMEASQSTVAQKIFKFADDVEASGDRTIAVLTKCDLVVTEDTDAFEAVSLAPPRVVPSADPHRH